MKGKQNETLVMTIYKLMNRFWNSCEYIKEGYLGLMRLQEAGYKKDWMLVTDLNCHDQ